MCIEKNLKLTGMECVTHLLMYYPFNLNDSPAGLFHSHCDADGGCVLVNYQYRSICLAQTGTGSLCGLRVSGLV